MKAGSFAHGVGHSAMSANVLDVNTAREVTIKVTAICARVVRNGSTDLKLGSTSLMVQSDELKQVRSARHLRGCFLMKLVPEKVEEVLLRKARGLSLLTATRTHVLTAMKLLSHRGAIHASILEFRYFLESLSAIQIAVPLTASNESLINSSGGLMC